mgnify:CR=1 FL=1
MRHWDKMKQDGNYWCGEFETDDIDWKLAELIVNMLKDANVNVMRKQKTFEGFERLPEEFTYEDIMRCFHLENSQSARVKIYRLLNDHLCEKVSDGRSNNKGMAVFKKTDTIML